MGKQQRGGVSVGSGGGFGGKADRSKSSIVQYRKRLGNRESHQLRYTKSKSLKTKEIPDFEPRNYIKHAKVTGIVFLVTMCLVLVFYFSGGYNLTVKYIDHLFNNQQ